MAKALQHALLQADAQPPLTEDRAIPLEFQLPRKR